MRLGGVEEIMGSRILGEAGDTVPGRGGVKQAGGGVREVGS